MRFLFLPVEKNHEYPSSPYKKEYLGVLHLHCKSSAYNKRILADILVGA